MIIKINGISISDYANTDLIKIPNEKEFVNILEKLKLKQIAITLFTATLTLNSKVVLATSGTSVSKFSMWESMRPLFGVLSDLMMSIGGVAIIIGLVTAIFNKRIGTKIVITTCIAVLACFLVPSALMLVAIIGDALNDALENAFKTVRLKG